MRRIQITTDRLNIFIPNSDEAEQCLKYFNKNKEHLRPTDPVLPKNFYTLSYWEKRLSSGIEEFDQDQSARFFIEQIDGTPERTKEYIGSASLTQIARGPFQACYLGYSIDAEFEGQGFMTEALKAIIDFAFKKKHLHRIMANYLPENKRSANVLKKLGFRIDGSSPSYLYIQGQWRDHILTSLTNQNWLPRPEDQSLFN